MVPEVKEVAIPYTTCHMVTQQHCRMITCRRSYLVPELKEVLIPYTTCHMVPEERCRVIPCTRCHLVPEQRTQLIPYVTCKMVAVEKVTMVPHVTCSLQPYCVTYKVCRQVPVCVPEYPVACPPSVPVGQKMTNSEWFARVNYRATQESNEPPASLP
jgi:hypothetical protein